MNKFYCEILNDDLKFIKNLSEKTIKRAKNLVRIVIFKKKKLMLIDEHGHLCDLSQILFIPKCKTAEDRLNKFNEYFELKMFNLNRYHENFIQFLKK